MENRGRGPGIVEQGWRTNRLRYGFNEIDGWPDFAFRDGRYEIWRRLRLMKTDVIRLFVFDKPVADPFTMWSDFAGVVNAVLASGAKPMITFAKFNPPYSSARQIDRFVQRVREIVWRALEEWGGEEVKNWYWCVWNEPNNPDVGGNLRYHEYLPIYEAVAQSVIELVKPHTGGARIKIGGPSIDGTQRAYWLDWIARILSDVDDDRLAFVNWHTYADWRPAAPLDSVTVKLVDDPPPPGGRVFEALTMAHTPQYEARARAVGRLIAGRDVLNVCGELNAIAHHEHEFTNDLNRNVFGAVYYGSALINLMRGGADLEMRWTATAKHWYGREDAYGLLSKDGVPTPAALAKQVIAQHVSHGDAIRFVDGDPLPPGIDTVIARDARGRRSAIIVNTLARSQRVDLGVLAPHLETGCDVLRLDQGTGGTFRRSSAGGSIAFEGCGIAVLSDDERTTVSD
ncbi:MAG: hypothetical protein AB7E80_08345 [Hyphomicrobiaceae bacterium]